MDALKGPCLGWTSHNIEQADPAERQPRQCSTLIVCFSTLLRVAAPASENATKASVDKANLVAIVVNHSITTQRTSSFSFACASQCQQHSTKPVPTLNGAAQAY